MEINKLEIVKQALLEAMQKQAEPTRADINKSAQNVLDDAIEAYLTVPQKTATIKLKGIALTHKEQGYSANLRPVSLLMKANVEDLTDEQKAALARLGYVINQGA
ncbi:TPA: hypothetical protein J4786_003290 [Citrobacter amalonaticus]|nr:hypothetical protein [Citrobacter amalonaticus]HAZ4787844.1 hypothetical protein [Citrobacter amalonaticus]